MDEWLARVMWPFCHEIFCFIINARLTWIVYDEIVGGSRAIQICMVRRIAENCLKQNLVKHAEAVAVASVDIHLLVQ